MIDTRCDHFVTGRVGDLSMLSSNVDALLSLDITDPTDFPPPSIAPGLRQIDSALRCKICKELIEAPVTLPCGHCFCSLVSHHPSPGSSQEICGAALCSFADLTQPLQCLFVFFPPLFFFFLALYSASGARWRTNRSALAAGKWRTRVICGRTL